MFDWLAPNWSNPLTVAGLLGARLLLNVYLTVMVAKTVGPRTAATAAMGAFTALSSGLTVLLLRPGGFGPTLSDVEFFGQVLLLAIAGYVVYSSPWNERRFVTVIVIGGATVLLVLTIPIYGERFVAP